MAYPKPIEGKCECNVNPTVSEYAACVNGGPNYFNDLDDMPNGACISHAKNSKGLSITTCNVDEDCLANLTCSDESMCIDENGVVEANRLVQICVSPKGSSKNIMAGCPYSGSGNADNILKCHKYWISDEGMQWKRYLQHNPFGPGDSYAWAYDEAVCGLSEMQRGTDKGYPWCTDTTLTKGAIDIDGNVLDSGCPCAVFNYISVLNVKPFNNGYGRHLHIHVYDVMTPKYKQPTHKAEFSPIILKHLPDEDDEFHFKVVNQYDDGILVWMDVPPARMNEPVTGGRWAGWTGPTQTLRGKKTEGSGENGDPWTQRLTIAPNDDPTKMEAPTMRVSGEKGQPLGGFYVPAGWHFRIHIATKDQPSGWFKTAGNCPETACLGTGTRVWVTHADGYNYSGHEPLLFEPNVNSFNHDDPHGFDSGLIWMDVSAVDGVNANMQLRYAEVDRKIFVPLFESKNINEMDDEEKFIY
jgi:hypothetical protein